MIKKILGWGAFGLTSLIIAGNLVPTEKKIGENQVHNEKRMCGQYWDKFSQLEDSSLEIDEKVAHFLHQGNLEKLEKILFEELGLITKQHDNTEKLLTCEKNNPSYSPKLRMYLDMARFDLLNSETTKKKAKIYYVLGEVNYVQFQFDDAEIYFKKAFELEPTNNTYRRALENDKLLLLKLPAKKI